MGTVTEIGLTSDERKAFAELIAEKGWTPGDLQLFALRHIDETGSRNPTRIARWLLAGGVS